MYWARVSLNEATTRIPFLQVNLTTTSSHWGYFGQNLHLYLPHIPRQLGMDTDKKPRPSLGSVLPSLPILQVCSICVRSEVLDKSSLRFSQAAHSTIFAKCHGGQR